jgi:hypothetical protein
MRKRWENQQIQEVAVDLLALRLRVAQVLQVVVPPRAVPPRAVPPQVVPLVLLNKLKQLRAAHNVQPIPGESEAGHLGDISKVSRLLMHEAFVDWMIRGRMFVHLHLL